MVLFLGNSITYSPTSAPEHNEDKYDLSTD